MTVQDGVPVGRSLRFGGATPEGQQSRLQTRMPPVCLLHSRIFQDMTEAFHAVSTNIQVLSAHPARRVCSVRLAPDALSCRNLEETAHCTRNLRGTVDGRRCEVGSWAPRSQMTQGCIFATKESNLVARKWSAVLGKVEAAEKE